MHKISIETPVHSGSDTLSPETARLLLGSAGWSRYLSVVGFVLIGILFTVGFSAL